MHVRTRDPDQHRAGRNRLFSSRVVDGMPTLHALRQPLVVSALTAAVVVGACSPGAVATPASTTPATSPATTSDPSPTGAPTTPAPTGTPVPTATPAATPTAEGHVDHPTGATDVVLRVAVAGGFVPSDIYTTQVPQFTLYGDGTVVYFDNRPAGERMGDPNAPGALPALRLARMTEEQMSALLRFALGPAGLLDARPGQYINPLIADAPSTYIDIDAGGVVKSFEIQALMEAGVDDPGVPDPQERKRFSQLTAIVLDFGKQVEQGNATDAGIYKPAAYRAFLLEQQEALGAKPWPFMDLKPADFKVGPDQGAPKAELTQAQVDVVVKEAYGGAIGIVLTGPDKKNYRLSIRPLLPDEEA